MSSAKTSATHLTTPDLFDGETLEILGDAYRHLFRARRLATGDPLRVVDGEGRARLARVESVARGSAVVALGEAAPSQEPALRVHLLAGALRSERAGWLVEKATELGVAGITFFASERTPRDYGKGKLDRWRRLAAAAVEQCGRSRLPEIRGVLPLQQALDTAEAPILAFMPGAAPLGALGPVAALTVVIGPEGGFGPEDEALLEERGAQMHRLGEAVLRVETAAVAALSLLLCGSLG